MFIVVVFIVVVFILIGLSLGLQLRQSLSEGPSQLKQVGSQFKHSEPHKYFPTKQVMELHVYVEFPDLSTIEL